MYITKKEKNKFLLLALAAAWFYVIPILYQFTFLNSDNPQKVIQLIGKNISNKNKIFDEYASNKALIVDLFNNTYTLEALEKLKELPFALQVYHAYSDSTLDIKFWNKNNVLPTITELLKPDGKYLSYKDNGVHQFIKKTIEANNIKVVVSALIPIRWEFFIETDYLQKEFAVSKRIEKKYTISTEPTIYPVKDNEGNVLVYLKKVTDARNVGFSWVYIICRAFSLFLIAVFIFKLCGVISLKKDFFVAFLVLFVLILGLRILCLYTNFPFHYGVLEYFDPRIYAANNLFKSLGDLTFNLFSAFLVVLFWIRYNRQSLILEKVFFKNILVKDVFKTITFVAVSFYSIWVFRSLIYSSKISFNVTNLFSFSIYSVLGFLHIAFLIIVYYLFTQRVIRIHSLWQSNKMLGYLVIAIVGLCILFFDFYWAKDIVNIYFLVWMFLYFFVSHQFYKSNKRLFSFNIFWLLFFSFFASLLFQFENARKEKQDRKWIAKKLAFQSDPNTESLLSIAIAKFDNNYLIKNVATFYNPNRSANFKDSLLSENFVGYLNKFQSTIHTYDSLERPLYNTDSVKFSYFNTIVQNQSSRVSNINDLYYFETGFDLFSYIFKKEIIDTSGRLLGYFIVQSNPINYKNKSTALSPELFKQRNAKLDDNGNNYIYAIYNKYELRKRFFDYDLPTRIAENEIPIQEDTLKYRNGYEELWLKLNKDSVVVVGKKSNTYISLITLFAYLFFSILSIVFLFSLLDALIFRQFTKKQFALFFQLNFSKQVQGIVWMVSLLTFIIVAIVIISLFKNRFNKTNKERLSRTMSILIADVQNKISTNAVFDDIVKIYEPGANEALKETIFQMSEIHNVDFNIYDLDGSLKLSSQPLIEAKGILSNKMDPYSFYYLKRKSSAQFVQQEKMGSFEYLSMYVPIRDESGKAYGYLNIPYYSSQSDLNQEISNFLITIINLTAFIFLIAGLIAWLVTNRITNSFSLIGNKMKEVGLGKNEIIEWNKDDEIGGLVKEYNKMVMKLEESAVILAKNEREGAWREMAKQVAHEIKNPLTPMKLSIQYLQKSIANGNDNIQELTNNVSKTLVEQIDHLNNIASDFSQFANIGNTKNEAIDIVPILNSLILLFNAENDTQIEFNNSVKRAYVFADKTQMNRLFTNLMKNAMQAYSENTLRKMEVRIYIDGGNVVVALKDFAFGIPVHLQEKIFTPNFTTKTSGTGLGLAISKGIVENAKGEIWFTTKVNEGTTFYVSIPLVGGYSPI